MGKGFAVALAEEALFAVVNGFDDHLDHAERFGVRLVVKGLGGSLDAALFAGVNGDAGEIDVGFDEVGEFVKFFAKGQFADVAGKAEGVVEVRATTAAG